MRLWKSGDTDALDYFLASRVHTTQSRRRKDIAPKVDLAANVCRTVSASLLPSRAAVAACGLAQPGSGRRSSEAER